MLRLAFDQIVHFAAIRTDCELGQIEGLEARSGRRVKRRA